MKSFIVDLVKDDHVFWTPQKSHTSDFSYPCKEYYTTVQGIEDFFKIKINSPCVTMSEYRYGTEDVNLGKSARQDTIELMLHPVGVRYVEYQALKQELESNGYRVVFLPSTHPLCPPHIRITDKEKIGDKDKVMVMNHTGVIISEG